MMPQQLPMFPDQTLPDALEMLQSGAALAISISGGKDSQAMTEYLLYLRQTNGWAGDVCLVHADLGRAEHPETPDFVRQYAEGVGIPLHAVQHSSYDLLEGIRHRMVKRPDAPPWPSAQNRYCTSDWKRSVISRWVRNQYPDNQTVVVAMGLRAEESPARAKRPNLSIREDCFASTKNRYVYDWLPIHLWSVEDVWNWIGGLEQAHPAYMRGNHRLSCLLCILGDVNDLTLGAFHDPALYIEYCRIEVESGYSFRQKLWLGTLNPAALPEDLRQWYVQRGIL